MVKRVGQGKAVVIQSKPRAVGRSTYIKRRSGRVSTKGLSAAHRLSPIRAAAEHSGLVPASAPPSLKNLRATRTAHLESGNSSPQHSRVSVPCAPKIPGRLSAPVARARRAGSKLHVRAKAMFCLDCSSDKVMLAQNIDTPLPIASITKLLTALVVIEQMDLDRVLEVPADITQVERCRVGLRPGDLLTVRDILHGMLIESGNDCAEVLARAYQKGGRDGFMVAMNRRAAQIGATHTNLYTPSGLDMRITLGRKGGRCLEARRSNTASAEDVALIAREAFRHPIIRKIAAMRTFTMRTRNAIPHDFVLRSNDRLLARNLPVAGAKTGYTNAAGRCIVALFKDQNKERVIVVLNTPHHFQAAEKIYRWASARKL